MIAMEKEEKNKDSVEEKYVCVDDEPLDCMIVR